MIKDQFKIESEEKLRNGKPSASFDIKVHSIPGSINDRYEIWRDGVRMGNQASYPSLWDCYNPIIMRRASQSGR